jgi:putative membrane protein
MWSAGRTLLSWVRTGVAMMGFGFLVERLASDQRPNRFAVFLGMALALLGGAMNLTATLRYHSHVRDLRQGRDPTSDVYLPTIIGIGSALISVALALAIFL